MYIKLSQLLFQEIKRQVSLQIGALRMSNYLPPFQQNVAFNNYVWTSGANQIHSRQTRIYGHTWEPLEYHNAQFLAGLKGTRKRQVGGGIIIHTTYQPTPTGQRDMEFYFPNTLGL